MTRSLAWMVVLTLTLVASSAHAQTAAPDLREAHRLCARSMVRIERVDGNHGSGWVVELGSRRYVVTNRHVVEGETDLWVEFDGGRGSLGSIVYLSSDIDLAIVDIEGDIPVPALRFVHGSWTRGERVVIGGNPSGLRFITTEGIVAGVISGVDAATAACGEGYDCLVLDAESEPGSSGGPVLDHSGNVIGMVWGVYAGTSFSIAIPTERLGTLLHDVSSDFRAHARTHRH